MTEDKNIKLSDRVKYIDIHSHLDFADYGVDQKEIIQKMKDLGIFTITIGTGVESSREAVKLAEENENIYACIGNHPDDELGEIFDEKDYEELIKNPKIVAIGECGLDYFRISKLEKEEFDKLKEIQIDQFKKQIEFAIKYNKPLMLHIRDFSQGETLNLQKGVSLGKSAYEDTYNILKIFSQGPSLTNFGNIHFYAGTLDWAKKFIELGFTISFTGVITFARNYDEVIKNIPLDKIHAETDSPFVAPIPYRGKRNEPNYVVEVYKKIAEIRGEDLEVVRKQLVENAKRAFCI
ncbi:MAG: TatD family hydrolase [Candidatus Paceibacterota bacterium]|jgi:TatD DNase family protein